MKRNHDNIAIYVVACSVSFVIMTLMILVMGFASIRLQAQRNNKQETVTIDKTEVQVDTLKPLKSTVKHDVMLNHFVTYERL